MDTHVGVPTDPGNDPKTKENSGPPQSSWKEPLVHHKPAEADSDGNLILFELTIRVVEKGKKVPSIKLMEHLNQQSGFSLNTLSSKTSTSHSAFFCTKEAREAFHGKSATVANVKVSFERYPPAETQHFVAPPKILSTKMRLISVPPHLPLKSIEKAIEDRIPPYIPGSASFETFASNRNVRNGNLSFFVRGIKPGQPFQYLRVCEYDVLLQNASHPLEPTHTPKISSEDPNPQLPKAKEKKDHVAASPTAPQSSTDTTPTPTPHQTETPDVTMADTFATKKADETKANKREIVSDSEADLEDNGESDPGFTQVENGRKKRRTKAKDKKAKTEQAAKVSPVRKGVSKSVKAKANIPAAPNHQATMDLWLSQQ